MSVKIEIPGRTLDIQAICTDYTGTLSFNGKLVDGVERRLRELATLVDIHVVTSDTRRTSETELQYIPLRPKVIEGQKHDEQKRDYLLSRFKPEHVAVLGNGRNDRLWLREVKDRGLAIAVDVGEGCAVEALLSADIFVCGICNALDLLRDSKRAIATLRTE